MERLEEMKQYLASGWEDIYANDRKAIRKNFNKNRQAIQANFYAMVGKVLIPKTAALQKEGKQGSLSYLAIQYLHSSLLNRTYEYEISLCSESLYVEEYHATVYWCPAFLYQHTKAQEQFLKKELEKKFVRVKCYELEQLRSWFFASYQEDAKDYFLLLTERIEELPQWQTIDASMPLKVMYGEYMGQLAEVTKEESEGKES